MRWVGILSIVGCVACEADIHGTGSIYVYNGTDSAATVEIKGGKNRSVTVEPRVGEMVDKLVAGPYSATIKRDSTTDTVNTEVVRERFTVINVGGAA